MPEVARLVDAWCERRCLRALREVLAGMPVESGLTDEWERVREALIAVRELAAHELTQDELVTVQRLIADVDALLAR